MQDTVFSNYKFNSNNSFKNITTSLHVICHYIVKICVNIIFILACLFTLVVLINFVDSKYNNALGNDVPGLFGSYVIVSPSMTPSIKVNDAILVVRTNPNNLKVGDIITFKSSDSRYKGYTITHRINSITTLESGKRVFTTKGDNNSTVDSAPVLADNVYGKVFLKIPKLGFLQNSLYKYMGLLLIIIFIIILYSTKNDKKKIVNSYNNDDDIEIIDLDYDDDGIEII